MIDWKKELKKEHAGFSGVTHWLIALFLFMLLWFISIDWVTAYVTAISSNTIMLVIIFVIIGGASLLPDLDSSPLQEGGSTAVYQLGALGYGLSILAITISGVFYNVFHTKYDAKPKSQHRMLFHSLCIPIGAFVYFNFFLELPEGKVLDSLKDGIKGSDYSLIILIFLAGISSYLGACMLSYRVLKLFKKQKYTQFVCLAIMAITIGYMLVMANCEQIKLIATSISLGYAIHPLSDLFSKGSAPLFFPIPLPYKLSQIKKLQFWKKPNIPFALTTGGVANTVLNFVLTFADLFLFYFLFIRKG